MRTLPKRKQTYRAITRQMSQSFRTSPFLVGDPLPTTPFFHARLAGLQATTRLPDGQFPCAQSSMHGIQAWQQGYGYAHVRFWKALFQSSDTLASWSFNAASDRPTSLELFWTHLHIRERTDGIQNFGPIWHLTREGANPPDLEWLPKQSFFFARSMRDGLVLQSRNNACVWVVDSTSITPVSMSVPDVHFVAWMG